MIEQLFWLGIVGALTALIFAFVQGRKVLTYSEGNDKMIEIAQAIRTGAKAYLRRQYRLVTIFFAVMFVILLVLSLVGLVNPFIPFAFVVGGFFTGLSGFIGMTIATNANARTAHAASESLNKGLRVSFSSGTVMGFVVAGLGLLDVTAWYLLLVHVFQASTDEISTTMITFGMGVACMAMFSRVGGGIFTKAADVGADLVGKVEAGIPEDDPRNPATIADNVGDNVGDVAGMGADLYESYTNAIVATFALGIGAGYGSSGLLLPILLASVGIVSSLIGTFAVKTKEKANQKELLHALHRGTFISGGISIAASLPLTFFVADLAGPEMAANTWGIFFSIVIGILTGFLIGWFTEYYTSDTNKPTKDLAKTTETGSATVMIGGISLGMFSTLGPVITIVVAAMASFFLSGGNVWVANPNVGVDSPYFYAGLYGIGIAAVGMLATLSINLACDAFGPVAHNAGGIAEMAGLPHEVRERTDALDSLGNTTAATGKGFAIGSTAFTALALLVSYVSLGRDALAAQGRTLDLSVTNPSVLMGILLGSMLIFFFGALTISAVNRAAQSIVVEVRRQFREIKGIMDGSAKPDYAACVDLCTRSAQKELLAPAIVAILSPIVTGIFFGVAGVVGLLTGIISAGFAMALFMLASGGAWDNAKKYIESGQYGGKGSDNHKAAVIGDTVGDPFKDTAGPSFNLLITLSLTVSIVFVGVTAAFSLF